MKILKLEAENLKRLRAVEIAPDDNIVEITGSNGAGKTSVLDAIWWALAGASHIQAAPIRKGETEARIRLDLGEIKVTRKFKRKDDGQVTTSLVVEQADGARFPSPQAMLDGLLGALSFDPLAFVRMSPKEQVEALRQFAPEVDFDGVAAANKADYDTRSRANRNAKQGRAAAEAIKVPPDTPTEFVDEKSLVDALARAGETNSAIDAERSRRWRAEESIRLKEEAMAAIEKKLLELEAEGVRLQTETDAEIAALKALPPLSASVDATAIGIKLMAARALNDHVRQRRARQTHLNSAMMWEDTAAVLTANIAERNEALAAAVAAAKLPVPGLSFAADGISLNGVPFEQASTAEQLRTSVAIAMTNNPKLRVIRVRDGSVLDAAGMKTLAEMAREHDFQVWIEVVESGRPTAIRIEDGQVVG